MLTPLQLYLSLSEADRGEMGKQDPNAGLLDADSVFIYSAVNNYTIKSPCASRFPFIAFLPMLVLRVSPPVILVPSRSPTPAGKATEAAVSTHFNTNTLTRTGKTENANG